MPQCQVGVYLQKFRIEEEHIRSHFYTSNAVAHRRFGRIRQVAPMWPHPKHASLRPSESTSQTAFRSVQPFLQGSWSWQTDRQTDRQTDHATRSATIGHIYVVLRCGLTTTTSCSWWLHVAWVVDDAKCIVVTAACVCLCLRVCHSPHSHTTARTRM